MRLRWAGGWAIAAAAFTLSCGHSAGDGQAPLGSREGARLARYVQKKYKLSSLPTVTEVPEPNLTGYRKVRFSSGDAARPFRVELYISPDSRFLTSELLDSTLDPAEEERRKEQALSMELTRGDYAFTGPANAPVTLTVFSDFQCPYCARATRMLTNDVLRAETDVRLIFRHYPLPNHAWARAAAEATACAQEQRPELFWKLHDFLFERQAEFTPETVRSRLQQEAAGLPGFDSRAFQLCLGGTTARAAVDRDIELGTRIGITGTPPLFVNSHRVAAVVSPEQIRTLIRELRPGR